MSDWRHREIKRLEAIKAGIEREIWQIVSDTDRLTRTKMPNEDLEAVARGRWQTIHKLARTIQKDLDVELRVLRGQRTASLPGDVQATSGRSSRAIFTGQASRTSSCTTTST